MAPEDKASSLEPHAAWHDEAVKGPGSPTVSKHVLLAHQLQSDAKVPSSSSCGERQTAQAPEESNDSPSLPPPPPLLSLQPPDVASLLPIPGLHNTLMGGDDESECSGRRRNSSSDSEDEDESNLSKKELRMRRNRESAARSRKRKRDEVEQLTGRVHKLIDENTAQRKTIESLRKTISDYRERFGALEEVKA